jgi:hypothetical protein
MPIIKLLLVQTIRDLLVTLIDQARLRIHEAMSTANKQARCACSHQRPRAPTYTQFILSGDHNNNLSLSRPITQVRHRRTPAPNAVRRITNQAKFSTGNPSLTSFLRFPPEVRVQIYGELLLCNDTIQYGMCATHMCLVVHEHWLKKRPVEFRHRLHPAILECCRVINEEGSEVLYGQNRFQIDHWDGHRHVSKTWPLAPSAIRLIRSLHLPHHKDPKPPVMLKVTKLFPKLAHLTVELHDGQVDRLQDFLLIVAKQLKQIREVLLLVHLSWTAGEGLWRRHHRSERTTKAFSSRSYRWLWIEQVKCQIHQDVHWEFEEETDGLSASYGSIGEMKIVLNT